MFSLFNLMLSDREKIKRQAQKFFDVYLPAIKGMNGEEIATVLDLAAQIKNATTMYGKHEEEMKLFREPSTIGVHYAYETLFSWLEHARSMSHGQEDQAKAGALAIWWLSVASFQIPELRLLGRELWAELARGFPYTEIFNPELDYVEGLYDHEPSIDQVGLEQTRSDRIAAPSPLSETNSSEYDAWRARVFRTLLFVFDIDLNGYLNQPTGYSCTVADDLEAELKEYFNAKKTSLQASISIVDCLFNNNHSPWIPYEIQRSEIGLAKILSIYQKCKVVISFDNLKESDITFYMGGYDRGFLAHCDEQIDGCREELEGADLEKTKSELLINDIYQQF